LKEPVIFSQVEESTIDIEAEKRKFIASKWETVDPDSLEKQAVTTVSKWDFFDEQQKQARNDENDQDRNSQECEDENTQQSSSDFDDDIDGKPLDDELNESKNSSARFNTSLNKDSIIIDENKRKALREIEVKTMRYVDDLENGKIKQKSGLSIQEQAEQFRTELIEKLNNEPQSSTKDSKSSSSSSKFNGKNNTIKSRSRSRSKSPSNKNGASGSSSSKKKRKSRSNSPKSRSSSHYHQSSSNLSSHKRLK
jgi:hypothetical protein